MGIAEDIRVATVEQLEESGIDLEHAPGTVDLISALSSAVASVMDDGAHLADEGYFKFPGGLILQWGIRESSSDSSQRFTFNHGFSIACYGVFVNRMQENSTYILPVHTWDKDGFRINREDGISGTVQFNFLAVGK